MSEPTPILTDAAHLRERVRAKAMGAVAATFPLDMRERRLEVKDLRVVSKHFSPDDQRNALLRGGSLDEALKGTLVLKHADGTVIDETPNFTVVHLPYLTERHTIIANGNEYQVAEVPKLKVEVAVSSGMTEAVIDAITKAAGSGKIGDGKIFVSGLSEVVRIRTGERDEKALD